MMNANRRLLERKQPERIVLCKLGGEEGGSVLNLSEDGLCFQSLTPTEEADLLQLRLSVDLNSAIEATGQLAWIDSAKRTGGLGFLELSVPAREQTRAWLSETSTASSGDKQDRKSTRLNSSHGYISYAVFCLKKSKPSFSPRLTASSCGSVRPTSRPVGTRPRRASPPVPPAPNPPRSLAAFPPASTATRPSAA